MLLSIEYTCNTYFVLYIGSCNWFSSFRWIIVYDISVYNLIAWLGKWLTVVFIDKSEIQESTGFMDSLETSSRTFIKKKRRLSGATSVSPGSTKTTTPSTPPSPLSPTSAIARSLPSVPSVCVTFSLVVL